MDNENTFWVNIWRTAGTTFICLATVVAGCQSYQTHTVKEMVRAGADPLRAACSGSVNVSKEVCAVVASQPAVKP